MVVVVVLLLLLLLELLAAAGGGMGIVPANCWTNPRTIPSALSA